MVELQKQKKIIDDIDQKLILKDKIFEDMALLLACNHENLLLKCQLDSTKDIEDPYKAPQGKNGSRYKMSRANSGDLSSKFKHRDTFIDGVQAKRISNILFGKCETIMASQTLFKKNKLHGKRIFENCLEVLNLNPGVIMSKRVNSQSVPTGKVE